MTALSPSISAPGLCRSSPARKVTSRIQSNSATARVQPAVPPLIFTGKQATTKPSAGSASRFCSFSMWL